MRNYKKELEEQIGWLDDIIDKTEKRIRQNNTLEKRKVRFSKQKYGYQYYWGNPDGKRVYVKSADLEAVRKKLQLDYDKELSGVVRSLRLKIEHFIKLYDMNVITDVYDRLCDARKEMVTPVVLSDKEFIEEWKRTHEGEKNTFPEKGQYLTNKGEYVRSKTEKILADLFYKLEIPYVYEPKYELTAGGVLFPDFALLNVEQRKTIYWEHFGLVTDGEYAIKSLSKLGAYEKSGLSIGDTLLFSMESEAFPLDIKQVEKKVINHLK